MKSTRGRWSVAFSVATLLASGSVQAQIQFNLFADPHSNPVLNDPNINSIHEGPIGFAYAGNKVDSEGLYAANYDKNFQKADANQFDNFHGDLIVTGEGNHAVYRAHWNGTDFTVSDEGTFPNQPEDGLFVSDAVLNTVPEPGSLTFVVGMILAGLFWRKRVSKKVAKS